MTVPEASLSAASPAILPAFIHATVLVIGEDGILIRGRSGAGKSSLALSLFALARAEQRFAALIGDDRVRLSRYGDQLVAEGHPAIQGQIELRGQGILNCEAEPAAVLRAIVDLIDAEPDEAISRLPEKSELRAEIGGVSLPRLALSDRTPSADQAHRLLAFLERARTDR